MASILWSHICKCHNINRQLIVNYYYLPKIWETGCFQLLSRLESKCLQILNKQKSRSWIIRGISAQKKTNNLVCSFSHVIYCSSWHLLANEQILPVIGCEAQGENGNYAVQIHKKCVVSTFSKWKYARRKSSHLYRVGMFYGCQKTLA